MLLQKQITLFGESYLLIGDMETGGPISTLEQYENFECSYAYLKPDGNIIRFGQVIGTREDIVELTVQVDAQIQASAGANLFTAITNTATWEKKAKGN